jgi:hypothetical protein
MMGLLETLLIVLVVVVILVLLPVIVFDGTRAPGPRSFSVRGGPDGLEEPPLVPPRAGHNRKVALPRGPVRFIPGGAFCRSRASHECYGIAPERSENPLRATKRPGSRLP